MSVSLANLGRSVNIEEQRKIGVVAASSCVDTLSIYVLCNVLNRGQQTQ